MIDRLEEESVAGSAQPRREASSLPWRALGSAGVRYAGGQQGLGRKAGSGCLTPNFRQSEETWDLDRHFRKPSERPISLLLIAVDDEIETWRSRSVSGCEGPASALIGRRACLLIGLDAGQVLGPGHIDLAADGKASSPSAAERAGMVLGKMTAPASIRPVTESFGR